MVEVYTSGLIKKQYQDKGEQEQLDALVLDFEDYKRTGMIPQHFGRNRNIMTNLATIAGKFRDQN